MGLKSVQIDLPRNLGPLVQRTDAIRESLVAQYKAGKGSPNEVVGNERELFIRTYLQNAYPNQFRWSSGFIMDATGAATGQLDIVVETNLGLSIPATSSGDERLFFAEMVGAVISIKSNLFAQWGQVEREAEKIAALQLKRHAWLNMGTKPNHVPFFVVAYSGATKNSDFENKILKDPVRSILRSVIVLDSSVCLLPAGEKGWIPHQSESAFLMFAASLHQQIAGSMDMGQTIWPYVCETEHS